MIRFNICGVNFLKCAGPKSNGLSKIKKQISWKKNNTQNLELINNLQTQF